MSSIAAWPSQAIEAAKRTSSVEAAARVSQLISALFISLLFMGEACFKFSHTEWQFAKVEWLEEKEGANNATRWGRD